MNWLGWLIAAVVVAIFMDCVRMRGLRETVYILTVSSGIPLILYYGLVILTSR